METGKLLFIALVCSIILSGYITHSRTLLAKDLVKNAETVLSDKNILYPLSPYDECFKPLIDQSNKESIKFDQDKAKSVCFELLYKKEKYRL
jgi:hypothetical protein